MRLPAAEPRSPAGLLFPSQYLSGTIWLTPYSMVWEWWFSRAGPMLFCWPSCSLLFCLQLFSLSLLFLYRLVVWGWGLRTDRVSISLSRPCIANIFFNNNDNNNNEFILHSYCISNDSACNDAGIAGASNYCSCTGRL